VCEWLEGKSKKQLSKKRKGEEKVDENCSPLLQTPGQATVTAPHLVTIYAAG